MKPGEGAWGCILAIHSLVQHRDTSIMYAYVTFQISLLLHDWSITKLFWEVIVEDFINARKLFLSS